MHQSSFLSKGNHRIWVIAAAASVLFWRIAALRWPSSFINIPDAFRLPIAFLGMFFLVCGLLAWWIRPGRWTAIFLVYCFGGGVHWGGAIGAHLASVELGLLFAYLTLTVLGEAAFLHLALIFPSGRSIARSWKTAIYAPAALALIFVPIAGFVAQAILQIVVGLLLLAANLLGIAAGLLLLVHLFRADTVKRRAAHLRLIGTSIIISGLVMLLEAGGILPGQMEAWNLVNALIPISLLFALISPARKVLTEQVETEPT